jgi:hypothetical protein
LFNYLNYFHDLEHQSDIEANQHQVQHLAMTASNYVSNISTINDSKLWQREGTTQQAGDQQHNKPRWTSTPTEHNNQGSGSRAGGRRQTTGDSY